MHTKKTDWKSLGQFFSTVLALFTSVRDTFTKMGIGLEIVDWITGAGKETFTEKFLRPLGDAYLAEDRCWRTVNENTIEVNLSATPKMPFCGATTAWDLPKLNEAWWVKVTRDDRGLIVGDYRVSLQCTLDQQRGFVTGNVIHQGLPLARTLHTNILDALFENQHLIPDEWKEKTNGAVPHIYFWRNGFYQTRSLGVRFLYYYDGKWRTGFGFLGHGFDIWCLAALTNESAER